MKFTKLLNRLIVIIFGVYVSFAVGAPKVAVPALAYEEQVTGYFTEATLEYSAHSDSKREGGERSSTKTRDLEYTAVTSYDTKFTRGNLRKFVSDIKGQLIRSDAFDVIEGKSAAEAKTSQAQFAILERIKAGDFEGADYVLFGTISSIDIQNQINQIAGTSKSSVALEMQMVVDFSLINTQTNAVIAAFSAIGEGSDVKLVGVGVSAKPSSARVIRAVSKALAEDVLLNIEDVI